MTDSATDNKARRDELIAKYNDRAMANGMDLQGEFFLRMVHELDELDASWAEGWMTWIYDFLYGRRILDDKTRILIVIGECVVSRHITQLANHMRSALEHGATPEEVLEVVFQASTYAGMPAFFEAMRVFRSLASDLGLMELTEPPFRGDARDKR